MMKVSPAMRINLMRNKIKDEKDNENKITMNTKHTLLGIALIMPLASFAQSEVQPNERKTQ